MVYFEGWVYIMNEIDITIGNIIRNKRKEKNITTAELAKTLNVSPGFINNLENGKTRLLDYEFISKLSNELEISLMPFLTSIFNNLSTKDCFILNKELLTSDSGQALDIVDTNLNKIRSYFIECISSNNYDEKFIEDLTSKLIYELKFLTKK